MELKDVINHIVSDWRSEATGIVLGKTFDMGYIAVINDRTIDAKDIDTFCNEVSKIMEHNFYNVESLINEYKGEHNL